MDYRNRYRRGGIIGLQEGGSWWDRMVSSLKRKELDPSGLSGDGGYMGSQYGEDPSYSVPGVPEADAHMDDPNWMNLGSDRGGSKYVRELRDRTPEEAPLPPWMEKEAARKRDIRDNWMYGLDGPPPPPPSVLEADAHMDDPNWMNLGKDEERRKKLVRDDQARILNEMMPAADAEEAATTQAIAAAEAASGPPSGDRVPTGSGVPHSMDMPAELRDIALQTGEDELVRARTADLSRGLEPIYDRRRADRELEEVNSMSQLLSNTLGMGGPPITDLLMEDLDPAVMRDKITQPAYTSPRELRALEDYKDLILNPPSESGLRLPEEVVGPESEYPSAITDLLMEDMDPRRMMEGVTQPPYMSPREQRSLEDYKDLILNPPSESGFTLPGIGPEGFQEVPSDYSFDYPRPDLPEASLFDTLDYEPHFIRDGGTSRRLLENNRTTYDELGEKWFADPLVALGENLSGQIAYGDEDRIKPRSKNWLPYPMGYKEKMWEVARPSKFGRQTPEERLEQQRLMTTLGMEDHPLDYMRRQRALNALYYQPTEENPMGWSDPLAGTDYRRTEVGYQDGGYIPGYGLGGFLKKALTFGAGAINPALGAGVGGLMGLLDKKNRGRGFLKGALAGGLAGLATSKLAGGGKEAWDATAGKGMSALEKIMSVGKGIGTGVDPAIKALSDPKVLAFGAPMLGNLMNPEPEETVEDTSASSFNVAPSASSNPANWKDGKFIGAQGSGLGVMQGGRHGGYISGYENGGEFEDEFEEPARRNTNQLDEQRRRAEENRQNFIARREAESRRRREEAQVAEDIEPAVPATIAATPPAPAPRPQAPVEAPVENVEPVARPIIEQVASAVPNTAAATPVEAPVENVEPVARPAIESVAPVEAPVEPWQLPQEPVEGRDEYEPVVNQIRDVVPQTTAFMPEPGEEGENEEVQDVMTSAQATEAQAQAEAQRIQDEANAAAAANQVENPYGPPLGNDPTQAQIDERARKMEIERRRQLNQPDPLLQDPVGADPTHGLDDGGEDPADLGFVDQTTQSPAEDPTKQYIENQFTGPTGHGIEEPYMGHGYNEPPPPAAPAVPATPVGNAGGVADHQDYVAGYHDETAKGTGETGASRVGLNPMKPQDQSALSTQQQDFIAQFGKAEGGPIQEAPAQIRDIIKAALMGTLPDSSIDVTQLMSEVSRQYPGLVEEIANEIRYEQQQAGGGPEVVREGYIPPFNDGMPESSGRVDDRAAAVLPSSDTGVSAGLERALAKGGKIPMGAVVAAEEYILDKENTAANVQDLKKAVDYVAKANPRVSGPPMWDATRGRLDMEQGINA